MVSYTCSIDTNPLSRAVCEILSLKHIWLATLTFRVTWRHRSRDHCSVIVLQFSSVLEFIWVHLPWATSYRCSVFHWYWHSISKGFWDIEAQMYLGHGLPFLGHVTSSVTWPFFPRYVVSYTCSIDTNPLSRAVYEILSLKHIWLATLTFRVTWRHRPSDHSIAHLPLPIDVPLVLTLYLQRIWRYWGSNLSGSRFWPF